MRIALAFCLCYLLLLFTLSHVTPANQPAQFCQDIDMPPASGPETVSIWAQSARWHCWRAYLPALGAAENNLPVHVAVNAQNVDVDFFKERLTAAVAEGNGPDIAVQTGNLDHWVEAGYLAPLDACRRRHPALAQFSDLLWSTAVVDGHTYGIPLDTHLFLLFFNKNVLRELGWRDAQITNLPAHIANGRFTLADILDVAQQAVERGIVDPGFGYWGHMDQRKDVAAFYLAFGGRIESADGKQIVVNSSSLRQTYTFIQTLARSSLARPLFPTNSEAIWSNRLVRHDAIAHGRVLFWHDKTIELTNLWYDFPPTAGKLFDQFGVAPRPSGIPNQPGNIHITPTFYVVLSERATGRQQQAAACDVLATTANPRLNARQANAVLSLGAIKDQATHPAFADHPLAQLAAPFLQSSILTRYTPLQEDYLRTLVHFAQAVEAGQLSPQAATTQAVSELERLYGAALIVEQ